MIKSLYCLKCSGEACPRQGLFRLRDESLEGADALPSPEVLAASIVEDLQTALEQFTAIAEDLGSGMSVGGK